MKKPKTTSPQPDMRSALALCSLALNPASPQPCATMVRIADGFMTSFGGTFAINIPMNIEIGCCFSPTAIAPFFRKERGAIAYTLKNQKLVLTEGKERLTVGALPPEELAIIDNLGTPIPVTFNMKLLKVAADIIDPENTRPYAKGVTFADGAMSSTDNKVFLTGESGLPDNLSFTLPKESCVALTKFKSSVTGILTDSHTTKLFFADGSSLCSKQLTAEFPDIGPLFAGEWHPLGLTEDLLDVACEYLEFLNGTAYYHKEGAVGMFEGVVNNVTCNVYKKSFDYLLRVGNNISVAEDGRRVKSLGENCVVVCSVKVPD